MVYLPTFTIKNQPNVVKHVPYMDPMGFAWICYLQLGFACSMPGKNIPQMVVCLIVIYHGRIRKQSPYLEDHPR